VGERTTESLVEEQEQNRHLDALGRELIGVAAAIAFQQTMAFEFAQIVAQLVQSVSFRGELKRGQNGCMDLFGGPAADGVSAMQQNFQQPDDPGIVDLDAGITDRADSNGQCDPLEEWKIDRDVQALSLKAGEAVGDGLESFVDCPEVIQPLLQTEVPQVVGAQFIAEVAGELFVLFEKGVLPAGAENMMSVLDLVDDGGQLPVESFVQADTEDLADAVGRQPPQAEFTAALEDFVDGEVAFENKVPAVLDPAME
jgi:hypothetical protein